jgi:hypothetical protein
MPDEKYIKIDPATGKAEYLDKDDGQKIAGIPKDNNLCFVAFKEVKIPKVITNDQGEKEPVNVDGYDFDCKPSPECLEKNKEAEAKQKPIREKVRAQQGIVDDKKASKAKKDAAKAELVKLREQLRAFDPYCVLKCFVRPGGNDILPKNGRLTLDDIKERKIQHVFCQCQKVELPS